MEEKLTINKEPVVTDIQPQSSENTYKRLFGEGLNDKYDNDNIQSFSINEFRKT